MSNNRDSNRLVLVIDIKVTFDDASEHILKSRNISDHGVFLEHGEEPLKFSVGQRVVLQVCAQMGDEPPPPVNAEIARITKEGVGLRFIL